ncbi:MAG TPA: cyanophycin synthetase, partial [Pseudoduganella sp.]
VNTVDDLARVKGVVANAASRCVVLNAEDRYCVRIGARLAEKVEILYFALDPDNPLLLKHLHNGGRGAYLQDGQLVIADGTRHQVLLRAADMPSTLGGHARYNIANGLAAAAALLATGFSAEQIAAGLASFVSDGRTNPLRSNVYDVRGVTVVVDYAHNPAAYKALSGMARGLSKGRVIGVITAPGDRRDEDLHAVGDTCARGFDEIVIYESNSRGRPAGECTRLMLAGAQASGQRHDMLHGRPAGHEALRHGLSLCKPGDVLVFACASSLNEVVEALRESDPASAQQIAAQAALV